MKKAFFRISDDAVYDAENQILGERLDGRFVPSRLLLEASTSLQDQVADFVKKQGWKTTSAFDDLVNLAESLGVRSTFVLRDAVHDATQGLQDAANHSVTSQIAFLVECETDPAEIEALLRKSK